MSRLKLSSFDQKKEIDKNTLTQDHHTLACFLVHTVFFQSILIKSFIHIFPEIRGNQTGKSQNLFS